MLLCIYLLLALLTYSSQDPGWSSTGTSHDIQNSAGSAGAWLADVCFSLFGYLSYLFPLMIAYRIVRVFMDRNEAYCFDGLMLLVRAIGFVLVIVAATGLVALQMQGQESPLPMSDGGILGMAIANLAEIGFGFVGANLLLLAVGLFGMTIFTDLSWLRLMDSIGEKTLDLYEYIRHYFSAKKQQRQEKQLIEKTVQQRKESVTKHIQKQQERIPPTIEKQVPKPSKSKRAEQEKQIKLFDIPVTGELPPIDLLDMPTEDGKKGFSEESLEAMSRLLELKLQDFGVVAEVVSVLPGPVVTRFEIQPAPGVKASRITNLAKDLARSMAVISVRVVEVIPGKTFMGIEIPNEHREIVRAE